MRFLRGRIHSAGREREAGTICRRVRGDDNEEAKNERKRKEGEARGVLSFSLGVPDASRKEASPSPDGRYNYTLYIELHAGHK